MIGVCRLAAERHVFFEPRQPRTVKFGRLDRFEYLADPDRFFDRQGVSSSNEITQHCRRLYFSRKRKLVKLVACCRLGFVNVSELLLQ